MVPGFSISEYDISPNGKEVVFATQPSGKPSQLWLATLDRSSLPHLIASSGENSPHFGTDGGILFRQTEGRTHYFARMKMDGSDRSKIVPYPIGNVISISPDRRWIAAIAPSQDEKAGSHFGNRSNRCCPAVAFSPVSARDNPTRKYTTGLATWALRRRFVST